MLVLLVLDSRIELNSYTISFPHIGDEIADLYVDNMLHVESYCLPQKRCYRFIMSDAYGDGMCCDNGNGYYKIKYGNSVIRESNFTVTGDQFPKYEEYTARFGKCD
jgi:hypothetical protein